MSRLLRRLFPDLSERSMVILELSDLSDWDLLCLMDVLPLEDLMRLGSVNHRFNQLAKRRQPGRRHLLIIISSRRRSSNYQNVITVPTLTNSLVDRILSKLPSIVSLLVVNHSSACENLESTIYLLNRLSAQLDKLVLVFFKESDPPTSHQPLFAAINRLDKLTTLCLRYRGNSRPFRVDEPAILHLPILSQLAVVHFQITHRVEPVLRELIKRATATTPTQIYFTGDFSVEAFNGLRDIPPGLASRFITLRVYSNFFNLAHLVNICDNYSNLTRLGFNVNHLTLRQMSLNLAKLTHLSKLRWNIHFPNRTLWRRQSHFAWARFHEAAEPDVIDSAHLVPIPAVTELELHLWISKHKNLALLHLGTLFPNVASLDVTIEQCEQCRYGKKKTNTQVKDRCFAKLIKYWRALPQLQQLKVNHQVLPDRIWKPLPLLGVSRFQLRHTIDEKLVDPVNKITSWITNKFTRG